VLSVLGCGTMGVAILNGISRALISNSAINCQYIVYLVSPCRNPRHTRWRMSSGTVRLQVFSHMLSARIQDSFGKDVSTRRYRGLLW
jgi:hypothetical protein